MPELPEVEVTRRRIEPLLIGRRISSVRTTRDSYFFLTRPAALKRNLLGRYAVELGRRGKYLLLGLDDGKRLMLHLGMTGQLFSQHATSVRLLSASQRSSLSPGEQLRFEPDQHTHLSLGFADRGPEVFFRDVRKFGKVRLLGQGQSDPRLDRLGVDALEASGEQLFRLTRRRKAAIKNVLLQQSVIAGIGNIYADEGLFLARIRPTRRASSLTRRRCEELVGSLQRVLLRSIESGGSSISDFIAPDGSDGLYQDERHAYGRGGEPCPRCGGLIRRLVLGQRSTHFCPRCQK
jgi:formamidopyrimidine-DNA glycosylase